MQWNPAIPNHSHGNWEVSYTHIYRGNSVDRKLRILDSFGYKKANSALFIEQLSKNINSTSNCYQGNCSYRAIVILFILKKQQKYIFNILDINSSCFIKIIIKFYVMCKPPKREFNIYIYIYYTYRFKMQLYCCDISYPADPVHACHLEYQPQATIYLLLSHHHPFCER